MTLVNFEKAMLYAVCLFELYSKHFKMNIISVQDQLNPRYV